MIKETTISQYLIARYPHNQKPKFPLIHIPRLGHADPTIGKDPGFLLGFCSRLQRDIIYFSYGKTTYVPKSAQVHSKQPDFPMALLFDFEQISDSEIVHIFPFDSGLVIDNDDPNYSFEILKENVLSNPKAIDLTQKENADRYINEMYKTDVDYLNSNYKIENVSYRDTNMYIQTYLDSISDLYTFSKYGIQTTTIEFLIKSGIPLKPKVVFLAGYFGNMPTNIDLVREKFNNPLIKIYDIDCNAPMTINRYQALQSEINKFIIAN